MSAPTPFYNAENKLVITKTTKKYFFKKELKSIVIIHFIKMDVIEKIY